MRPGDPTPTSRNLDPLQHPFARARERMRALNAAKMERIFAKPFVAALEGHVDAVETMARKPDSLDMVASGSWDGGVCVSSTRLLQSGAHAVAGLILHDIPQRRKVVHVENAHKGKVSGICFADNDRLLSCGVDRNVKLWSINPGEEDVDEDGAGPSTVRIHSP